MNPELGTCEAAVALVAGGIEPSAAGEAPLAPSSHKTTATAIAQAALAGIEALPSRDDRGRRTLILRRGAWCKEVLLEHLNEARVLRLERS